MAKRTDKTPDVIDMEPTDPEVALVVNEGSALKSFVAGLAQFFEEAQTLERAAKRTLASAKLWKQPTTKPEDELLVERVRTASRDKKGAEDHWQITQLVYRFHKRLTAARGRSVEPLEEAIAIGNKLHASYADAERRRAQAEEARLRQEAEERARQAREQELADLDAQKAAAEAASENLSDRESRYVDEWLRTGNRVTAARLAGYRDAAGAAARLSESEKIKAAIVAREQAEALRRQLEARREAPLEVEQTTVKAEVAKGGAETWAGEVLDEQAFIAAVISGKYGIPWDLLTVRQTRLNDYARDLHENLNRWPGVRATKKTSIR